MANERDTHFQNAAKLLVEKTMATKAMDTVDADRFLRDDDIAELQTLFAQFAYGVVRHALEQASHGEHAFDAEIVFHRKVTDLTEWPNTSPEAP